MKCTEKNFITRLKRQKEDALTYIIDHYAGFVHAIASKILANQQELVEECVNDVFLTVWQQSKRFNGSADDFRRWLGMMTKYKAIDRLRTVTRQQGREVQQTQLDTYANQADVQQQLLLKEERENLLLILSTLGTIDRDIFIMKYYLELSHAEIAEALELSIGAVNNRLYRGKKKLAKTIQLKERFI